MKKSKRIFAALAVLLVLLTLLSAAGCGSGGNRFVGKWRSTAEGSRTELEFRRDGTATLDGEEVYYEIEGDNKLKIKKSFYYYECTYEFSGSKKLSLVGDSVGYFLTGNYEKVKK